MYAFKSIQPWQQHLSLAETSASSAESTIPLSGDGHTPIHNTWEILIDLDGNT